MRVSCLIPVAALAALTACTADPSRKGIALPASIERFIPADTVVLAGARIDQIHATPLYQRLMTDRKIPELDRFVQQTGLDPRRDLQEIVVASNGKQTLLIARGRMADTARLEQMLVQQGAERVPLQKYSLLASKDQSVVFIDQSIALAAPLEHLKAVLSQAGGAKPAILQQVSALAGTRHVWAVATGGFAPVPLPESGNLANLNRVFQSLENVSMTMDLSDGLNLAAAGLCNDEKNARQLHDMLRGLIGFGRLSTPSDRPELLRFFDGVRVDHDHRKVKVDAAVPMDLVDQFLAVTEGERKRRQMR